MRPSFSPLVLLAVLLFLAAGTARAQFPFAYTNVTTQTSISTSCVEPSCDCFSNGTPVICPGGNVENFDSGNAAGPTSHSYSPTVSGQFVGIDSHTNVAANVDGNATYPTLHAFASGSSVSGGAYVLAGGLAIPGTSHAYTQTLMQDQLTLIGAPGAAISITFTQVISIFTSMVVGTGSGVDPCLANASAYVLLNGSLNANSVFTDDSASAPFSRFGRVGGTSGGCLPLQGTGSPIRSVTLSLHTGDKINFNQVLQTQITAQTNGGLGLPTNPNRVLDASATLDASHSARLYIDVTTPGASYSAVSGTIYPAPEPGSVSSLAAGFALLAARMRRSSRGRAPGRFAC